MKKETKKRKVLKLLSEGMKPKDIAAKLKIKTQQVYAIKSEAKKKMQLPGQIVFVKDNSHLLSNREGVPSEHAYILSSPIIVKKSFFQKLKEFFGA